MIGLIVTGHGHFATGFENTLEVIAGKQKCIEFIDFNINDSIEVLRANINNTIKNLKEQKCDEILFLTDILGGSPFNVSVLVSKCIEKSNVIAGTNFPMILFASLERDSVSIEQLKKSCINIGKEAITSFEDKSK